jgi:transposase-like protein
VFYARSLSALFAFINQRQQALYIGPHSAMLRLCGGEKRMGGVARDVLAGINTVADMVAAFADEERCRRLLEATVWPRGRTCPACGCREATALAGRDVGRCARPGLYQCRACRFQFTVTTRTPLHSTKLPLRVWLTGLWLILQSDKGISSVRLAEAIGVSQPTAWRMGHALRLLVTREHPLEGTVEMDEFYIGASPRKDADRPHLGRGRKASRGRRRRRSLPLSRGRQRARRARRRGRLGLGWWRICPNARRAACWARMLT